MPSSYSSSLRLELMADGEKRSQWGQITNKNLGTLLEQAISGVSAVAMTDADKTLTAVSGDVDESRRMVLNVTGANTAIRTITIPSVSKVYVVRNATTGGFAVNIKTAAGSPLSIANGATKLIWCDGTTVRSASDVSGADALAALLTVDGAGSGLDADTIDGFDSAALAKLAGATFTGATGVSVSGNIVSLNTDGGIDILRPAGGAYIDFKDAGTDDYDARISQVGSNGLGLTASGGVTINGGLAWHSGNDGSGSGLDADKIRGVTPTAFMLTVFDDVDANEARTTLGIGPQAPATVSLSALSAVTPANDTIPYFNGTNSAAVTAFTLFARTLCDDTDAATARATLGLGSAATSASTAFAAASHTHASTQISDSSTTGRAILTAADAAAARTAAGIAAHTAAEIRANSASAGKFTEVSGLWGAQAFVTLSYAATVVPDFSTGFNFSLTMGGNATLNNPTNAKEGQSGVIKIVQDATGSRTMSFGSAWIFGGGTDPSLSTGGGAVDYLFYVVESSTRIVASLSKGVA